MNIIQYGAIEKSIELPDHVVLSNQLQELIKIHYPNVNLAIVSREGKRRLKKFISELNLNTFPSLHESFHYSECSEILKKKLKGISKDEAGLDLFINDISTIVNEFSRVVAEEFIRFNLYIVEDDMCKYFHSDYNNLRLLCTYHGEGTQWIENNNTNRDKLGCEKNEEIIIDSNAINQLETFWIALLKGEAYPDNLGNGIIHRSPPMGEKKNKRILLKLDA